MKKNLKVFGSMIDDRQILIGQSVQLFGYLVYRIFSPPDQTHIPHKSSVSIVLHNALPHSFIKIANSLLFLIQMFSFMLILTIKRILRRNILNFKGVSIFAIFIVFISIFSLNVNYLSFLNNIYNDDCLICDTGYDNYDYNSDLSIFDIYQIPSNDHINFSPPTKICFFSPCDLTYRISTRAPPV